MALALRRMNVSMANHIEDDDLDMLDLREHMDDVEDTEATKPMKCLAKRGRPVGSKGGAVDIAKQHSVHRKMVLRALPGLSFDIRRQAALYRNRKSLRRKSLCGAAIKNIHHLIGEVLGESLPQLHARSAVKYLLATQQADLVVEYLESCRGRAIDITWEQILKEVTHLFEDSSLLSSEYPSTKDQMWISSMV